MKRFKNLLFIIFGFALILSLSGCGNKTAISADSFNTTMEEKGYTLVDGNGQFVEYDYIKQVYLAQNKDKTYQIEFYEISDEEYASSFFNNNKNIFENSKGSTNVESSVSLGNYSKYVLETDGKYKVISRIENTVIFLNVDSTYKNEVQDILKELGY